jgi:hypothetical protein
MIGVNLIVLLVVLQAPTPIPEKTANDPTRASQDVQNGARARQKPASRSVSGANVTQAPSTKVLSEKQSTENAQNPGAIGKISPVSVTRDWADWGYWAFSGLLVIVGLLQVWLLRGALRATEKAAQASVMNSEALVNSERAWVVVDADGRTQPLEHLPGTPLNLLNFFVWNAGKTPARVTYTRSEHKIIKTLADLPDHPTYADWNRGTSSNYMLAPVAPNEMGSFSVVMESPNLEREGFGALYKREIIVYAHGQVEYVDAFGKERHTNFGFCWHVPVSGEPLPARWVRAGPPAYNDCT